MERCGNCERPIGNLETPHLYRDVVVCAECKARLDSVSGGAILEKISTPSASKGTETAKHRVCPNCHSNDTFSLPSLFEQGSTAGSVGLAGVSGNDFVVMGGVTSSRTVFAQRFAPPDQRDLGAPIAAGMILVFLGAVGLYFVCASQNGSPLCLIASLVLIGIAVFAFYSASQNSKWNSGVWPGQKDRWDRSWGCIRCGHNFVPEDDDSSQRNFAPA